MLKELKNRNSRQMEISKLIYEFMYPYRENETINHKEMQKDVEKLVSKLSKPTTVEKRKVWIS